MIPVCAASADNDPDSEEPIRVGYYENEVFQEGAAEGAVKNGYAYEYYRKISEYTGWSYEYIYGDFSDLYRMLLDGEIDLLAGLAYRQDRAGIIGYPNSPMGNESYNLIKHEEDTDVTHNPSTLKGKTIGILDSVMYDSLMEFLSEHQVQANVKKYDDYTKLFSAFDSGDIDVLAAEGDGAYGRDHAEFLYSFGQSDYYLCVNIKRSDLLAELNDAQLLLSEEEPNYINTLRNKYYPVSVTARAFSEAEKEWLSSHQAMRVGYLDNFLPYSDTDINGKVTGIIKEYLPELLKNLGVTDVEVVYQSYQSYDDMVKDLTENEIDVTFPSGGGLYFSEETGIYQTYPIITTLNDLVYKGEYNDKTRSVHAVNKDNRMQYYYVISNYPDAQIKYYSSIDECLNAVKSGEATCTILNGMRAGDILRNRRYRGLSVHQTRAQDNICLGVKIGNEGLLKLLNRGINVMSIDYVQTLSYLYNDGLYSYSVFDAIRDNIFFFAAAAIVVAAFIIFVLARESRKTKKEAIARKEAYAELEKTNRELSENKEALSDALIAAEHANRAKTAFLNNMSHDIRTPMNAIVGFTALAASHIDNKEQVKVYLSKISVSSQHLLSLINDVLDMSRIESGKVSIEAAEVHLPDVIHDLRTIIQANINAKRMELFIDTQDVKHEDIISDRLRLNQILLNILSNAIKFTPDEGTISFRVIEKPSSSPEVAVFEFRIKDNGIGMSEEFQAQIFDAFTREKSSTVTGIQGTGLGMAITKNIVDMMGGTISVNSTKGKGSEFIVNIPCKICSASAEPEPIPELFGLRALVADDDVNTCLSVCAMLREIGMRPDWTNYGKEAVIRAKEALENADEFKVYIIDWLIPDQNGIETVRQIRKVIGNSTPIIILTAYDWADIEAEALEAGVTAFCSKPLFMSELRTVLTKPFTDPEPDPSVKVTADFSGKRILLAEDNEMNQMIANAILEEAGFEIDTVNDGDEAVEKMKNAPEDYYDIILMDIQMPRMNGYEAARQIRQLENSKKAAIPIVAVTANAFEEDKIQALESGMNGHLAKPYDIPEMMKALKDLL